MPRLFQNTWNGIDLVKIARMPESLRDRLPTAEFYAEFYRQIKRNGWAFDPTWLKIKQKNSKLLKAWIELESARIGIAAKKLKVLSIGVGVGIVEIPLLADGYDITLHDVQESSFEFMYQELAKNNLDRPSTLIGQVADLPHDEFHIIYLGSCEYCYSTTAEYQAFLQDLFSSIKTNGSLIALDPSANIKLFLNDIAIATGIRRPSGILWGRIRTPNSRCRAFKKAGFKVQGLEIFDDDLNPKASLNEIPSPWAISFSESTVAVIKAIKPH